MSMRKQPVPVVQANKKFAASQFVRAGLNEDEIVEIKEAFDLFDTDGGGEIDPKGTPALTQSSRQP